MTKELRDKLASLRAIAPKLNASTSEAGKVVQEVEAFLESLGVGVPAFLPIEMRDYEAVKWLAYDRVGGKFRIHLSDASVDSSEPEATTWGSLPRALKLETFARLPELLNKIVDEATAMSEVADKTVAEVRSVLGSTHDEATDKLIEAIKAYDAGNDRRKEPWDFTTAQAVTRDEEETAEEKALYALLPEGEFDGVDQPLVGVLYGSRVYFRSDEDHASVSAVEIVSTIHGTPAPSVATTTFPKMSEKFLKLLDDLESGECDGEELTDESHSLIFAATTCANTLPARHCDWLGIPPGSTYAQAAIKLQGNMRYVATPKTEVKPKAHRVSRRPER